MNARAIWTAALVACFAAGLWGAWSAEAPPAPRRADADPRVFSAGRAMVIDREISERPRPEGSAEAQRVRDLLFARMAALGLRPLRQEGLAVEAGRRGSLSVGEVENLIGTLPGGAPGAPAVLVMAHTDSVPASPGAADDAAGVSAALEAARALSLEGHRRRPLVLLLTDGEENGLFGARVFFAHPPAGLPPIGAVLNLESRGGGGRVVMFQTADHDANWIRLFSRSSPDTDANSLTGLLYKSLPNDTDFTIALAHGLPGFNFAFIGNLFDYHSPSSTSDVLDQGSVQQMGEETLGVARALVDGVALPKPAADLVYADLFGRTLVLYPMGAGWIFILLAALLIALGLRVRRRAPPRRGAASGPNERSGGAFLRRGPAALRKAALVLLPFVLPLVVVHGAALLLDVSGPRSRALLAEPLLFDLAIFALAAGVALLCWRALALGKGTLMLRALALAGLLIALGFWVDAPEAVGAVLALGLIQIAPRRAGEGPDWALVLLLGVVLTVGVQLAAPAAAFIFAWPTLAGALAFALYAALGGAADGGPERARPRRALGALAATLFIALSLCLWLGRLAAQLFDAVGASTPEVSGLILLLAPLGLFPLLARSRTSGLGAALLGLGAGALVVAAVRDPFTARRPRLAEAFVLQVQGQPEGRLVSSLTRLDPWSRAAISSGVGPLRRTSVPPFFPLIRGSRLPATAVEGPRLVHPAAGTVFVRAAPADGARQIDLVLTPDHALGRLVVDGLPTDLNPAPGRPAVIHWFAPAKPLEIAFPDTGAGGLDLAYREIRDGVPAGVHLAPMRAAIAPTRMSETTVMVGHTSLHWSGP